ncbi:hypothetical protein HaLaN_17046 [Haematococcus lacustris]|uniref:Uncharacterized protein n=1 Tax=Haematococcus lacustris TaxID=44745 RepID=A0A699ZCZ7_HAELA|nr:hypothetical protein HaLaN_17046 [Haematococcus lacustris]
MQAQSAGLAGQAGQSAAPHQGQQGTSPRVDLSGSMGWGGRQLGARRAAFTLTAGGVGPGVWAEAVGGAAGAALSRAADCHEKAAAAAGASTAAATSPAFVKSVGQAAFLVICASHQHPL